jgi:hypothetical protein
MYHYIVFLLFTFTSAAYCSDAVAAVKSPSSDSSNAPSSVRRDSGVSFMAEFSDPEQQDEKKDDKSNAALVVFVSLAASKVCEAKNRLNASMERSRRRSSCFPGQSEDEFVPNPSDSLTREQTSGAAAEAKANEEKK